MSAWAPYLPIVDDLPALLWEPRAEDKADPYFLDIAEAVGLTKEVFFFFLLVGDFIESLESIYK